jgi:hypothetical protein
VVSGQLSLCVSSLLGGCGELCARFVGGGVFVVYGGGFRAGGESFGRSPQVTEFAVSVVFFSAVRAFVVWAWGVVICAFPACVVTCMVCFTTVSTFIM